MTDFTIPADYNIKERAAQNLERLANIASWHWEGDSKKIVLNTTAIELLGISNLSPSIFAIVKYIVKEDRQFVISVLRNVFKTHYFPKFYFRVQTGMLVRHLFTNGEINLAGDKNDFFCYGIIQDVTESRKLSDRLKQQNKQLIEISRIQSHELRSPVATILGLTDLLASGNLNPSEQVEILDGLKATGQKLDGIIQRIDAQTSITEL